MAEGPQDSARGPARMTAAVIVLVLGLIGLGVCVTGVAMAVLPRRFTAAQQQAIMNWEVAARWRQLTAGSVFHATVSYQPSSMLDDDGTVSLSARRVGIAPQSSCGSALDASAATILDPRGCQAVLRATYTDTTDSYVVTVGVAVLAGTAQARAAAAALPASPGLRTARFPGTAAARFTDARRQLSGGFSDGPYVVFYTAGYADDRPKLPVSGDQYVTGEMTSMASGIAHSVADTIAAPPSVPHCPGAPGC